MVKKALLALLLCLSNFIFWSCKSTGENIAVKENEHAFQVVEAYSEVNFSGVYSNFKGTETIYLRLDLPKPLKVNFISVEKDSVILPISSTIVSGEQSEMVSFESLSGEIMLKAVRILYNSDAPIMVEPVEYAPSSEFVTEGVVLVAKINGKEVRTSITKLYYRSTIPKP